MKLDLNCRKIVEFKIKNIVEGYKLWQTKF